MFSFDNYRILKNMYNKQYEIEEIIEDLIENNIVNTLINSLASKKECEIAIEILRDKLDEFDSDVFLDFFE